MPKAMFDNAAPAPTAANQPQATVAPVKLSDGSFAHNVLLKVGGIEIVFAAMDVHRASQLANAINDCAWIERV